MTNKTIFFAGFFVLCILPLMIYFYVYISDLREDNKLEEKIILNNSPIVVEDLTPIEDLAKDPDENKPIKYLDPEIERIYQVEEFIASNMTPKFFWKVRSIDTILETMQGDCTDAAMLAEYMLEKDGYVVYLKHGFVTCIDGFGDYLTDIEGNPVRSARHDWAEVEYPKNNVRVIKQMKLASQYVIMIKIDPFLKGFNCEYEEIGGGVW